jgi:hypothetical protein
VVALLTLGAVAYASPPDPTWVAGLWDNGDHDDVVMLVTSMAAAADANLVPDVVPVPAVASVATLEPESISLETFSPNGSRAPPAHA